MKGLPRSRARGSKLSNPIIKQTIRCDALSISVTATGAAIGFGSAVAAGLPEGNILWLGAVANLTFTGPTSADLVDTWEGDFGVGTTPASDATITGADVDLIQSTALAAATAEVSPTTRGTSLPADTGEILDNTAGTLEVNVNLLVDAADQSDSTTVAIACSGEIYLSYIMLGDD